ncbi:MAG: peptide chain release factor N(5)-glutamine methyltransferase [Pedobacter sp.]|nr:peptide chain release factor N(5)-glutamine methyltransferase [Pedobacter sp.]
MNLKDILRRYHRVLDGIYDDQEIVATFYIVAEYISGLNRIQLSFKLDELIPYEDSVSYNLVLERLKNHEPIQYILSEAYFYGLKFKVDSSVLIPRPETEELVEMAINAFKFKEGALKIIDIGTGSGCIAISLKHSLPSANISAMDISHSALEIAAQNAVNNKTSISLVQADIRDFQCTQKFDLIISNPPYITEMEATLMDKNVLNFEPKIALFVPNHNPLEFYVVIADFALKNLKDDGYLFFEINANYGKETIEMLINKSFSNLQIFKDMQGKERFITAKKPSNF